MRYSRAEIFYNDGTSEKIYFEGFDDLETEYIIDFTNNDMKHLKLIVPKVSVKKIL